jgi:uncharacterized membrane protein
VSKFIKSSQVFRILYNSTLDTFPSAFLLLVAAIVAIITYLAFVVYSQRSKMLFDRKGKRINR